MKRFLCVLFCVALLISSFIFPSFAEENNAYIVRNNDNETGSTTHITSCDDEDEWTLNNGTVKLDKSNKKEGLGSVSFVTDIGALSGVNLDISSVFEETDITGTDTVEFDLFLSDTAIIDASFQITAALSSSGNGASNTLSWLYSMTAIDYVAGWNHIRLDVADAAVGNINLAHVNYFRLYFHTINPQKDLSDLTIKIDNICATSYGTRAITLDLCEEPNVWNGAELDAKNRQEGNYCYTWTVDTSVPEPQHLVVQRVYDKPINATGAAYLEMDVYLSDASAIHNSSYGIQVEVTSSGTCDHQEYSWSFFNYPLVNGWNHLRLPITDASHSDGYPNMEAINFCRFHMINLTSSQYNRFTFKIDNLYFSVPLTKEDVTDVDDPDNPDKPDIPDNPEDDEEKQKQAELENTLRKRKTVTRARILVLIMIFNIVAVDIIVVQLRKQKEENE